MKSTPSAIPNLKDGFFLYIAPLVVAQSSDQEVRGGNLLYLL
jgi:hypothetical protein